MTREEFATLLKNHDWGFQYSDDREAYSKGSASWATICAATKNPEFNQMFEEYINRRKVT